jgi:hypothetical protein
MPITASLGALSYSRTSIGEDYEYWYMKVNTICTFTDLTFDNEDALYITGITQEFGIDGSTLVTKFTQPNNFPQLVEQYAYGNYGPTNAPTANSIKYDSYLDKILLVGTRRTLNVTFFPNYLERWILFGSVYKTLGEPIAPPGDNSFAKQRSYPPGPPSNVSNYIIAEDAIVDPTTGWTYTIGPWSGDGNTSNPQGQKSYTQWESTEASGGDYNLLAMNREYGTFTTASPLISNSCSIVLDSNYDPILCLTTQTTVSTTTRKAVLRKVNKTRALSGFNYYLPTIWERKITGTASFQSVWVRLDSSDNNYMLARDNTDSFLLKYNSSGVLQWQRKIAGIRGTNLDVTTAGDIYITGSVLGAVVSMFVAKFDTSGTIQWQNKLGATTAATGAVYNMGYTDTRIIQKNSALYIVGLTRAQAFAVKLPSDGSIPGTGSYPIGSGLILQYTVATQIISTSTLVDASLGDFAFPVPPALLTSAEGANPMNLNTTVINV